MSTWALCVLLVLAVCGVESKWLECPGTSRVRAELNRCTSDLTKAFQKNYPKSCYDNGINTCLCEDAMVKVFECYVNVWDACSEHEALSGLHWDFSRFISFYFFQQVGDDCPYGLYTTTPETTTAAETTTVSETTTP